MTKTMGQIAYEAANGSIGGKWDLVDPRMQDAVWQAAADAVLEHVAIIVELHSGFMDGETAQAIAESIRSLKSTKEV